MIRRCYCGLGRSAEIARGGDVELRAEGLTWGGRLERLILDCESGQRLALPTLELERRGVVRSSLEIRLGPPGESSLVVYLVCGGPRVETGDTIVLKGINAGETPHAFVAGLMLYAEVPDNAFPPAPPARAPRAPRARRVRR